MALNKEKVQDLIDDFVVSNVEQINDVSTSNPILYDAVIDALNLLSRKFGNVQTINVPKPAAPQAITMLNPLIKLGAQFKDTRPNKLNTFKISEIDFDEDFVTSTDLNDNYLTSDTFSRANDNIKRGIWEPVAQSPEDILSINVGLNPLVQVGAKFRGQQNETYTITYINNQKSSVEYQQSGKAMIYPTTFDNVNSYILHGLWVPIVQNKTILNPVVQKGAEFKVVNALFEIVSIDDANEIVEYKIDGKKRTSSITFHQINARIEDGDWVLITLNPIVQVGAKFLEIEDDVTFSVITISQSTKQVLIDWENDPVREYITFEEFNEYLESAAWVVAPEKTQGLSTEAEILEAIEGLQLLDDDDSKKEITELKKQLKQLKNKKP
jgi:hypothetical protein